MHLRILISLVLKRRFVPTDRFRNLAYLARLFGLLAQFYKKLIYFFIRIVKLGLNRVEIFF